MANVILNRTGDSPKDGNVKADGTVVHADATAAKKAELMAEIKRLTELENRTVAGAPVRTPKARMLDFGAVEKKDPDHHYRLVNIKDPEKVASRVEDGYVKVAESEGGRSLGGEFALMKQPVAQYHERKAREAQSNRDREGAAVRIMEQASESAARELRDNHGLRVRAEDILIRG